MPTTRSASRQQKRKRSVPVPITIDSDSDSDQSSVDQRITQSRTCTDIFINDTLS